MNDTCITPVMNKLTGYSSICNGMNNEVNRYINRGNPSSIPGNFLDMNYFIQILQHTNGTASQKRAKQN